MARAARAPTAAERSRVVRFLLDSNVPSATMDRRMYMHPSIFVGGVSDNEFKRMLESRQEALAAIKRAAA